MTLSKNKKTTITCKPRFRVKVGDSIALGPGKVDLLEAVDRTGSISQAARELKLSYRRAWGMIDTMNRCFKSPLVESATGGKGGGGAQLTRRGKRTIELYRNMEEKARHAVGPEWSTLRRSLKTTS